MPKWFALDETGPLLAFAGIWTEWTGVRGTKANPVEGRQLLLPPTTARKARDRNEVSEREIKFSRSRLRRITHKIGRRFWNECRSFCFVSLDRLLLTATPAAS